MLEFINECFTFSKEARPTVIEDCSKITPELAGYYIILENNNISVLKEALLKLFPGKESHVSKMLEHKEALANTAKLPILSRKTTYTQILLNEFGSAEDLLINYFPEDFVVETEVEDVEEPITQSPQKIASSFIIEDDQHEELSGINTIDKFIDKKIEPSDSFMGKVFTENEIKSKDLEKDMEYEECFKAIIEPLIEDVKSHITVSSEDIKSSANETNVKTVLLVSDIQDSIVSIKDSVNLLNLAMEKLVSTDNMNSFLMESFSDTSTQKKVSAVDTSKDLSEVEISEILEGLSGINKGLLADITLKAITNLTTSGKISEVSLILDEIATIYQQYN